MEGRRAAAVSSLVAVVSLLLVCLCSLLPAVVVAGDEGEPAVGSPDTNQLCVSKCGTCPTICTASPPTILPMTAPPPPALALLPLSAPPPSPYLELVLPPPPPGDVNDLLPPVTPLTSPPAPESPCSTPPSSSSSSSSSEPPPSPPAAATEEQQRRRWQRLLLLLVLVFPVCALALLVAAVPAVVVQPVLLPVPLRRRQGPRRLVQRLRGARPRRVPARRRPFQVTHAHQSAVQTGEHALRTRFVLASDSMMICRPFRCQMMDPCR
ncbi:unnamed protein product [Miscanthus lutarioriparius]|uniref:Uncharacterized protein n=1 Tax=Miscanthus lutarioriparius TaxID=422564 RepID=A0A811QGJ8_9POAL|nr:unnamed protein product [Miscanthus lutarioriparius]